MADNYLLEKESSDNLVLTEEQDEIEHQESGNKVISDLPALNPATTPNLKGTSDECLPISVWSRTETYKVGLPELTSELNWAACKEYPEGMLRLDGSEELSVVQDGVLKRVKAAALGGGERLNVKEYGATGSGNVDDTSSIEAAIRAVVYSLSFSSTVIAPDRNVNELGYSVSGRRVEIFFPPGVYRISRPLKIDSGGIRIRGAGPDYTTLIYKPPRTPKPPLQYSDAVWFCPWIQKSVERDSIAGGNGLFGLTIVADAGSRSALRLERQTYFIARDVRLEAGEMALDLQHSADSCFANVKLKSASVHSQKTTSLSLKNCDRLTFDNVTFEGEGDGARIEGGRSFFHGCHFHKNSRHGLSLVHYTPVGGSPTGPIQTVEPAPFVSLGQCTFDDNGKSAIYQAKVAGPTTEVASPATVLLTDSILYGRRSSTPMPESLPNLIEVHYCDLDIRSSPAPPVKDSYFDHYLWLPEYGSSYVDAGKISVNIENHEYMKDYDKIHDPSGIVTGTVSHPVHAPSTVPGTGTSRVHPHLDFQHTRALMVEVPDHTQITAPPSGKRTWTFLVDLEEGGVKTLYLDLLNRQIRPGDDCTLKFDAPAIASQHTLRAASGQELDLLLVNRKTASSPAAIPFRFPDEFLLPDSFLPPPGSVMQIKNGESKRLSFIYLDRVLLARVPAASPGLPGIGDEVDLTVVVDPNIKPGASWDTVVVKKGRLLNKITGGLLYLELDRGAAALDRQNQALRWNKSHEITLRWKLGQTAKVASLSGCWIQT